MTNEITQLSEVMEKFSQVIWQEFLNLSKNLSGSLMAIECGTLIKIPMAAGYVSYYKSADALNPSFKLSLWLNDEILQQND